MLVIVEHRDVERLAKSCLDLETPRRGDVFEVDPAVDGGDQLDGADDLVGVLRCETHRPCVDVGEPLEQQRLSLHDGERRFWSDIAETEHRGAVGDDGDGVALDRQIARRRGVLRDRERHSGNAWRVRHREVVPRPQRDPRGHTEHASEVHQQRPVAHRTNMCTVEGVDSVVKALRVIVVHRVAREVDDEISSAGLDDVERRDDPARVTNRGRDCADEARVIEVDSHRHRERSARVHVVLSYRFGFPERTGNDAFRAKALKAEEKIVARPRTFDSSPRSDPVVA